MPQFTIYKNRNPQTKALFPFLLDVQSPLLDELQSRVVIPMTKSAVLMKKPVSRLTPIISIEGVPHLLVTYQLAAIGQSALGTPVADATDDRAAIIAALDVLITGI